MSIPIGTKFLEVTDHSVSKEKFELYYDNQLDLLVTYPQPEESVLPTYYQSDDYISHTDSKRSLFENAYHFVKNIALKKKVRIINAFHKEKGTLLDIGAGTGDFLVAAKNDGWKAVGTEPSRQANAIASQKGVSLIDSTKTLNSHSVDIITMWHVLEHVPDYTNQIKELSRLLKSDGRILIAVPNFNSYDAKHYGEFWAAYDVPRHLWHFSKTAIKSIADDHGLELVQVHPMKFDAFYVSLLSEKYKTGKMNYLSALLTGFKSNYYAIKSGEYSSHIYILKHKK